MRQRKGNSITPGTFFFDFFAASGFDIARWLVHNQRGVCTMSSPSSPNVTQLLHAWANGAEEARDELIPLVYDTLHRIARRRLREERQAHTLEPTALVNEAYLKLVEQEVSWQSRAHFFGVAARLMREILIDYARARQRHKRGGEWQRVSLTAADNIAQEQAVDLLLLDTALQRLAAVDPRKSQVVELRYFGGLTLEETATVMNLSTPTIEREWRTARAWLQTELGSP
jgi:RNA polymerase sigma factor (TIGR02999 family)